jgi:hypothetical protein
MSTKDGADNVFVERCDKAHPGIALEKTLDGFPLVRSAEADTVRPFP